MTSGRPGKRGRGAGAGEKRKSKKDDLRSKNREAQRRFREKQKCASPSLHLLFSALGRMDMTCCHMLRLALGLRGCFITDFGIGMKLGLWQHLASLCVALKDAEKSGMP